MHRKSSVHILICNMGNKKWRYFFTPYSAWKTWKLAIKKGLILMQSHEPVQTIHPRQKAKALPQKYTSNYNPLYDHILRVNRHDTHAYSPETQEMPVKRVRRGQCSPIPGPRLSLWGPFGGCSRTYTEIIASSIRFLGTLSSKTKRRYTTNRLWFPLFGNHSHYRAF